MDSPALKTKRHWNSFTGPFFLPLDAAARQLAASGAVAFDAAAAEALLRAPLRCHRCGEGAATMPALKAHLGACTAPLP
ncbi:MAG: hypothetical protein J3K34DRAFT_405388 [Monoraphidium minutum]|nr:MAG: hypothetical protein J3K34DRAFT_405388 [Monoraphidium minutum]